MNAGDVLIVGARPAGLAAGPLTITEPATALTDYLMACLAVWFAASLGARASEAGHARWWSRAPAFLAAGALTGGTYHGLQGSLAPWLDDGLWRATLAAAAFSSFATMRAVALQWLGHERRGPWAGLAAIKLMASLAAGAFRPIFAVVVLDLGLTMLFAACAGIIGRSRSPGAFPFLAAGIALFAAGAVIQQARLGPHPAFNHNDLFHAVQILANLGFFLSARLGLERNRGGPAR